MQASDSDRGVKVLFVTHYAKLYGANRALLRMVRGLRGSGIKPHVLVPGEGPFVDELRAEEIPFQVVPFRLTASRNPTLIDSCRRAATNWYVAWQTARQVRDAGFAVVYTNSAVTDFGCRLAGQLSLPHVWHIREFGDLDYNILPASGRGKQVRSFLQARTVISVSQAIKRHHFGEVNHENVVVVYDGVASREELLELKRRAEAEEHDHRNRAEFIFVLVGLMQPLKGQKQAIEAVHRVVTQGANAKLWLVGGGGTDYERSCRELAGSLGIAERVNFFGFQLDPLPYFIQAQAGLMCSDAEAFGLTTLECMACSRPVIGHATGGTLEIIQDHKTGLLYQGGVEALADRMLTLIRNRDLATRMGANAWVRVRDHFSVEKSLGSFASVFRNAARTEELTQNSALPARS